MEPGLKTALFKSLVGKNCSVYPNFTSTVVINRLITMHCQALVIELLLWLDGRILPQWQRFSNECSLSWSMYFLSVCLDFSCILCFYLCRPVHGPRHVCTEEFMQPGWVCCSWWCWLWLEHFIGAAYGLANPCRTSHREEKEDRKV